MQEHGQPGCSECLDLLKGIHVFTGKKGMGSTVGFEGHCVGARAIQDSSGGRTHGYAPATSTSHPKC